MATPVLATKLYVPAPRREVVTRPRLLERLTTGRVGGRRLTLVCAPAGFGKSTLLSEWAASSKTSDPAWRVAWLSLDERDNDPSRFMTHVLAALHGVDADIVSRSMTTLESTPTVDAESVLIALINDVAQAREDIVLVLDDYHVIEAMPIHDAVAFLLDHLPAQLHVAIATRSDPPLPLARLRARNELTELRAADLRFTPGEAGSFLNQAMGLDLSTEDVAALEARTEGWIAGLQLAALSLRERDDVAGFIQSFTGSHRFVLDYLVEEVLERQPDRVRDFLLQTAVLDRLTGSLCDAVTGQVGGSGMLETLERANLFVVPLDDERQWYRYHHLFADMLRSRAWNEEPDRMPALHRLASEWYERNDLPEDAVRHALAAKDFERAAHLMEAALPAIRRSRHDAMLLGWLNELPDGVVRRSAVLSVFTAWMMLTSGDLDAVEQRLQDAERAIEAGPVTEAAADAAGDAPVHGEEFRNLPVTIALYRASLAQALGDVAGTTAHARQALELSTPGDHFARGAAGGFLGLAAWASGDLDVAVPTFSDAVTNLHAAGNLADELGSTVVLADMWIARGRLREAQRLYEHALTLAGTPGEPVPGATADLHVGVSELHCEFGALDTAVRHLQTSASLDEAASLTENRYRRYAAMARVRLAVGDTEGAIGQLDEAERAYRRGFFPEVRPIAAMKARIRIVQGRLREAEAWALERGVSAVDELSYLREYDHLTLARLLIAKYREDQVQRVIDEAVSLLDRLLEAAEAHGRGGSVNEILVLQALAEDAKGQRQQALAALERALVQTEPEGYVRLFLDEGAPMSKLLRRAATKGVVPGSVDKLLRASGVAEDDRHRTPATTETVTAALSERELQVLELLKTTMSGPEIARELFISVNTLRTHTRHIFEKLEADSRAAAVRRAEERGLI